MGIELRQLVDDFGKENEKIRGAFYTKNEIVKFMLDSCGYTSDKNLLERRLLDPGFGEGAFVIEAAKRLLDSLLNKPTVRQLFQCIRAYEVSPESYAKVSKVLTGMLENFGFSERLALEITKEWLVLDDYLLSDTEAYDYVVGNPPYVRLENLNTQLLDEYKRRFTTVGKRTDLYIPFFEHSLRNLKQDGLLSFICTDRWLKSQYGEALRSLVDSDFYFESIVKVDHKINPFEADVTAYPAIFNIRNTNSTCGPVSVHLGDLSQNGIKETRVELESALTKRVCSLDHTKSWHLHTGHLETLFKRLSEIPTFEEAGLKIGIGVATGKDSVFIVRESDTAMFEKDRLIKLAMREDVTDNGLRWSQRYLINTFEDDGDVINLEKYPKTKNYFYTHRNALEKRHIAKKKPSHWYRTIDKPNLSILSQSRLYIPDIMFSPTISLVNEGLYPHHNLYWIASDEWDLRCIKTVFKSVIGFLFVDTYSTLMRGGYYRYQAQTLRKMRLPLYGNVDSTLIKEMAKLEGSFDYEAIDNIVSKVYGVEDNLLKKAINENEQIKTRLSKLREIGPNSSNQLLEVSRQLV